MKFEETTYGRIKRLIELSQKINEEIVKREGKDDSALAELVRRYNLIADGIEIPKDACEFILYTMDLIKYFKEQLGRSDEIIGEKDRQIKIYKTMMGDIEKGIRPLVDLQEIIEKCKNGIGEEYLED